MLRNVRATVGVLTICCLFAGSSPSVALPIVTTSEGSGDVLSIWGFASEGFQLDVVFRRGHSFTETFGDPLDSSFEAPFSLTADSPAAQSLADAIAATGVYSSFNGSVLFAIPVRLNPNDDSAAVSWREYVDVGDSAQQVGAAATNLHNPIRGDHHRAWADITRFSMTPPDDPRLVPEPSSVVVWLALLLITGIFRLRTSVHLP